MAHDKPGPKEQKLREQREARNKLKIDNITKFKAKNIGRVQTMRVAKRGRSKR